MCEYLGAEVIAELREAKAAYDEATHEPGFHDLGYVICKEDGTPYHPDSLTKKWERFTESNGLPHIKLHGMRHTNATALIGAGVNEKVVSERLGFGCRYDPENLHPCFARHGRGSRRKNGQHSLLTNLLYYECRPVRHFSFGQQTGSTRQGKQ